MGEWVPLLKATSLFQLRDDSNKILMLARVFLCVYCSQKTSPASGNLLPRRFRRAINLEPSFKFTHLELARVYELKGMFREAAFEWTWVKSGNRKLTH
jgi:hypothetical protein